MKAHWFLGVVALTGPAIAGCSAEAEVPTRSFLTSCDDGRPTALVVARDLYGMTQAVADGDGGFLLFGSNTAGKGVVRVDHAGHIVEVLDGPVEKMLLEGASPTGDGGAIVSSREFSVLSPEADASTVISKMDPTWQVVWQTQIGPLGTGGSEVRALPDGGAIVVSYVSGLNDDAENASAATTTRSEQSGVFWRRLSPTGALLWEHRATYEPPGVWASGWWSNQSFVIDDEHIRLVVGTRDGLLLLSGSLDGAEEPPRLLDTRLALSLVGVAALPDGRLAVLSERDGAVVTMVGADGLVLWEKAYGRDHGVEPFGIATNAARSELLLSGSSRGTDFGTQRTWLMATDFAGETTWSLERAPMALEGTDGNVREVDVTQGPAVLGLAIAPDGTAVGAGYTGFELTYFTLGSEVCQ
jgi:hypothetical protein